MLLQKKKKPYFFLLGVSGEIRVNGKLADTTDMKQNIAYVMQVFTSLEKERNKKEKSRPRRFFFCFFKTFFFYFLKRMMLCIAC